MVFYTTFEHSILVAYLQPKNRSEWSTHEVSQNGTISLFIARNLNFDGLESIEVWNNLTNLQLFISFLFISSWANKMAECQTHYESLEKIHWKWSNSIELSTNIQVKALERLKKE